MAYCPRSSLPAGVLAWLAARLAHLTPSRPLGQGGTPPLCLEVRLDAVAAVLLDGLSYWRAGRMVGILQDRGRRQPGPAAWPAWRPRLLPARRELRHHPGRPACAACGDGPVRRGGVRGRAGHPGATPLWVGQPEGPVRHQAPRPHRPGAVGRHDLGRPAWLDGGWPGSCHEHELIRLAGLQGLLDKVGVVSLLDRGFRGMAKGHQHWHAPVGDRRTIDRLTGAQRADNRL